MRNRIQLLNFPQLFLPFFYESSERKLRRTDVIAEITLNAIEDSQVQRLINGVSLNVSVNEMWEYLCRAYFVAVSAGYARSLFAVKIRAALFTENREKGAGIRIFSESGAQKGEKLPFFFLR